MWKCYSLFTAQNDFIDGSLKVDGAVDIVNPIGQFIENEELWGQVKKKRLGLFAIPFFWEQLDLTKVVYSADWHPQNHISFFSNLQSRWSKWFQNKQLRTDWHISPEPSTLSGVRAILAKSRCSTRFRKFHNPFRDDSRLCLRLLPQTDPSLTSKHSGLTIASKSLKVIDEECDLRLFPQPGAKFHKDLPAPASVLRKGTNPEVCFQIYQIFQDANISLRSTPTLRSTTTLAKKARAAQDWLTRLLEPLRSSNECSFGKKNR